MAELEARVPYQFAGQLEQLRKERANVVVYGQQNRIDMIDAQLVALEIVYPDV